MCTCILVIWAELIVHAVAGFRYLLPAVGRKFVVDSKFKLQYLFSLFPYCLFLIKIVSSLYFINIFKMCTFSKFSPLDFFFKSVLSEMNKADTYTYYNIHRHVNTGSTRLLPPQPRFPASIQQHITIHPRRAFINPKAFKVKLRLARQRNRWSN